MVSVCTWLSKFEPVLVPPSDDCEEDEVDQYFKYILESESDVEYEECSTDKDDLCSNSD